MWMWVGIIKPRFNHPRSAQVIIADWVRGGAAEERAPDHVPAAYTYTSKYALYGRTLLRDDKVAPRKYFSTCAGDCTLLVDSNWVILVDEQIL